jgi:rifampicin phosphotransferase
VFSMHPPYLVPLASSGDRALCGGKASGLAALLRHGVHVPPGVCVTTRAYFDTLRAAGLSPADTWARAGRASQSARQKILDEYRGRIASLTIPDDVLQQLEPVLDSIGRTSRSHHEELWAVRSSATTEDEAERTFAGLYRTVLGVPHAAIPAAITECWASLWTSTAWAYYERAADHAPAPAMAVIVQPLLSPRASGVTYSQHPVTRAPHDVLIEAVLGLAEPLVGGTVPSDRYIVRIAGDTESTHVLERHIAAKPTARRPAMGTVRDMPVATADQAQPSLTDQEACALARLTKQVERAMNHPVDVEWAIDEHGLWLLQSRSIPGPVAQTARGILTEATCAWSRANFKETLPDQPSPLGLSLLQQFMATNIIRQYVELGCTIPPGLSSVRIIHGRPYINVTLFQSLMTQLGGDPSLVAEHMGGNAPEPSFVPRLPWWKLLKAGLMMERRIRRAANRAPRWFAEMKCMAEGRRGDSTESLSPADLLHRLDRLGERLSSHDLTFAIVAGVAQGFSVLQRLLERRVGDDWRPLLNAALQGSGTVISARQIMWLSECANAAREEPVASRFFHADPWEPGQFRIQLAGTRFLHAFDGYLNEYGHRAVAESDVMSPRFVEVPDCVLDAVRGHVISPPSLSIRESQTRQSLGRERALQRIRMACRWRYHEWAAIKWWHRRLSRFLALREANRHHLMYFTSAVRQLLLAMGRQFAAHGVLGQPDDIFFLTNDEIRDLVFGETAAAQSLVKSRRAERVQHATQSAPDFVMGQNMTPRSTDQLEPLSVRVLHGLIISSGIVTGPVRLVRTHADFRYVQRGDIVVTSILDPGMAPLFGLAGGLIAEMGGILSHGAIIAREYGIPTVVNIPGVTRFLRDGQRVTLNADDGVVAIL